MTKEEELAVVEAQMRAADLPLKESANNLVFGKGDADAEIFFIGEAPGKNEDEQGLPFVGMAGKQLDELLASINIKREQCYISSILKYRPPNNRVPKRSEIEVHTPFLVQQIKIIDPKIIVTLGNHATHFVLAGFNTEKMSGLEGVSQIHGTTKMVGLNGRVYRVVPTFHPAALFYNRGLKQKMLDDFQYIAKEIAKS